MLVDVTLLHCGSAAGDDSSIWTDTNETKVVESSENHLSSRNQYDVFEIHNPWSSVDGKKLGAGE